MVQSDIWNTPLPNGMLQWFGYDFERVDLPGVGVLKRGEDPVWVQDLPGFTWEMGISNAMVTISAQEFQSTGDEEKDDSPEMAPTAYTVVVRAHGLDRDEEFTCPHWHKVQQRCRDSWSNPRQMTDELTRLIDHDLDAMPPAEQFPTPTEHRRTAGPGIQ